MIRKLTLLALAVFALTAVAQNPKREFRGAWMHTVFQDQYHNQTTEQNKKYIKAQLDRLSEAGVNAVVFQIRPQADAFYPSNHEPWSRFLTDNGNAPSPYWDPLQFIIDEAHDRGMELHAWLNPYRVTSSANQKLPADHVYYKHPEWFIKYDNKLYFDPALPESREFITQVVGDIISRYDVDGIHFDDYFYPYPVKGQKFPDMKSYEKYGDGMDLGDWRRKNVDMLIESVHNVISATKPWVIFGISPFGIWRNKLNDPRGSETNGLQNYDSLYADVLLWARNGWIDYQLPQLYWEIEHKSASYLTLVEWWNNNAEGRNVYIGQSISNIMSHTDGDQNSQLKRKIELAREGTNIQGNCWWPAYELTKNNSGIADSLVIDYQATVALPPTYPWISDKKPRPVSNFHLDALDIVWDTPDAAGTPDDVNKYVVYRFEEGDPIDLNNVEAIECITWKNRFSPEYPGVYVVTALSRVNQESKPSASIVIKK